MFQALINRLNKKIQLAFLFAGIGPIYSEISFFFYSFLELTVLIIWKYNNKKEIAHRLYTLYAPSLLPETFQMRYGYIENLLLARIIVELRHQLSY